jgi:hypothetical protein
MVLGKYWVENIALLDGDRHPKERYNFKSFVFTHTEFQELLRQEENHVWEFPWVKVILFP